MRRVAMVMLGSVLWGVSLCAAQDTQDAPSPDAIGPPTTLADQTARFAAASVAQTSDQPSWIVEQRACEGCPQRSVGKALFQTTIVNVMYGVANLVRGGIALGEMFHRVAWLVRDTSRHRARTHVARDRRDRARSDHRGESIHAWNNRPFATIFYEGRHLYSLDGERANHFLQRGRVDLLLPLRGAFGVGVTGEYFDRRTFYQDAAATRVKYHYPQVRAYFTGDRNDLGSPLWIFGLLEYESMRSRRTLPHYYAIPRGFKVCHVLLHSRATCSSRAWVRHGKFLGHELNPGAVASLNPKADKLNVLATDLYAANDQTMAAANNNISKLRAD